MHFRITDDGEARDIHEIHEMLKVYNRSHREASKSVPIGVFLEDENGKKSAGLTGETFGNCFAFNTFLSANRSEVRGSEASCWRLRRVKLGGAAANMPLWTPFHFRLLNSIKSMDISRFLPLKNIHTPGKGTIIRKNYFDEE